MSFADPPVSKEMGYEISITESPQKMVKYSTMRSPMSRKDSPTRLKQTKLKLVQFDTEKINNSNTQNENCTEIAAEAEKNESLIKIPEAYSDVIEQVSSDSSENSNIENIIEINSCTRIDIDELELAQEIEITTDSVVPEDRQFLSSEDSNDFSPDTGMEDSEGTQQDIFDGMDTKTNVTIIQMKNNDDVIQNNATDSVKLDVTDDSVIAALPTKDDNPTNMEDTIDIQNITGLNSTVNTYEVFCEKPIRSSTHATENVAEEDTLPITDSVFASLSTQDTQNQEAPNNPELDSECLDSTQSIYPTLSSCVEPVNIIIEQLTYPLWKHNLSTYFANRNIHTIGDFAQLPEREVNSMPMKGKPKIEFVKKILEHFESTCMPQMESSDKKSNEVGQLSTKVMNEMPTEPIAAVSDVETRSATIDNESLTSTPFIRPTENISDNLSESNLPTEDADKTESITSDMDISLEPTISDNSNLSALDISKKHEQTSAKIVAQISKSGTSTDDAESVPIPSSSSEIM